MLQNLFYISFTLIFKSNNGHGDLGSDSNVYSFSNKKVFRIQETNSCSDDPARAAGNVIRDLAECQYGELTRDQVKPYQLSQQNTVRWFPFY